MEKEKRDVPYQQNQGIAGAEPDGTDGYHPAGKNFGKRYCGACRGWAQHLLLPF